MAGIGNGKLGYLERSVDYFDPGELDALDGDRLPDYSEVITDGVRVSVIKVSGENFPGAEEHQDLCDIFGRFQR